LAAGHGTGAPRQSRGRRHRSVQSREAFSAGRYALADLYLVSNADEATLRARRDADKTRTRRGFARHVLLRDSLLRWYHAIDELEPGRVRFGLPETGLTPDLLAVETVAAVLLSESAILLSDEDPCSSTDRYDA